MFQEAIFMDGLLNARPDGQSSSPSLPKHQMRAHIACLFKPPPRGEVDGAEGGVGVGGLRCSKAIASGKTITSPSSAFGLAALPIKGRVCFCVCRLIRHSGESRNPEAASAAFVVLDTGFRRYDAG
jgi:hypothetical protein